MSSPEDQLSASETASCVSSSIESLPPETLHESVPFEIYHSFIKSTIPKSPRPTCKDPVPPNSERSDSPTSREPLLTTSDAPEPPKSNDPVSLTSHRNEISSSSREGPLPMKRVQISSKVSPSNKLSTDIVGINRPQREFKILLAGENGVGKTSLALRFCKDTFNPLHSISLHITPVVRYMTHEGNNVKIQLLDTSANMSVESLNPHYFRYVDAIGLVYDITNLSSFEQLDKWMEFLKGTADPDVVVFFVGTKCDLMDKRQVPQRTARKLSQRWKTPVFEASALSGVGVNEAFVKDLAILRVELACAEVLLKWSKKV